MSSLRRLASVKDVQPNTTLSIEVDDFKVCVKRIRMQDEDGETVKSDDDDKNDGDDIRFEPGLIDVTNGLPAEWGKVEIPTGFKLSRMQIKVKKDEALCGVNYSVKFNAETTPQDIEFKFRFDPAIDVSDGSTLNISMAQVVEELRLRADNTVGHIGSMKERIEAVEGSGH